MKVNIQLQEDVSVKRCFANSLLDLMNTSCFDQISVSAIVEKCGLSRATFYRHFADKNDLLSWIYLNMIVDETIKIDHSEPLRYKLVVFCQSFKDNLRYYKNAFSYRGQNSLLETMVQHSDESTAERIRRTCKPDEKVMHLIRHYSLGNVQMLYEWVMAGAPGTAEYMADMMLVSVPVALAPHLLSQDRLN